MSPFPITDASYGIITQDDPLYPLYESKLIHQFNHRYASFATVEQAASGKPQPNLANDLENARRWTHPRYWVSGKLFRERFTGSWFLVYREVTNATNERTVIAAIVPERPCGHSLVVIDELSCAGAVKMCANLNALIFDFVARQKTPGVHLNLWIWKQLPLLCREAYSAECQWSIGPRLHWIRSRVLELTYTAWDLERFAADCGYRGPPYRWDDSRRFVMRCELDAAYFHLYGIGRDDVDYIMDTFPIVRRKDEAVHGEYRTKRVILEIYDAMAESIRTGRPYQTRLDPPPGPPTDPEGNFLPVTQWDPANWPPHIHLPRSEDPAP